MAKAAAFMLIILVILFELFLSALYNGLSTYSPQTVLFPPAGLFGLLFLGWAARDLWAGVAAFLLGILADTCCGTPVGVYLLAYIGTFFGVLFLKHLIPEMNLKYFLLCALLAFVFTQLLSSIIYLAVIQHITLENIHFSLYGLVTTLILAPPVFWIYNTFNRYLVREE